MVEDVRRGEAVAGLVAQKHGAKVYVAHSGFPYSSETELVTPNDQDRVHPTRLTSGYNILAASARECCQAHSSVKSLFREHATGGGKRLRRIDIDARRRADLDALQRILVSRQNMSR